jgi:thiol-disulfide isomerase/thioredoxin
MKKITAVLPCLTLFLSSAISVQAAETPRAAPACALTAFNNTQGIDLQQFKGSVVYVDFWASWCGPCAESFPFMNNLHKELKDRGLQVLGINLDENIEDAKLFLEKHPAGFTVVTDANQQCAKDFDVKGMPSSYLIDRSGMIRHVHLGFRPGEAQEFRALVEQLLTESPAAK